MQMDNMLLQACKNNQKSVVQMFLKRGGVDVNKRDESGNTPLIYSCMKNSRDLVKMLIEGGADVNLANIGVRGLHGCFIWLISECGIRCILRERQGITRLLICSSERAPMSTVPTRRGLPRL